MTISFGRPSWIYFQVLLFRIFVIRYKFGNDTAKYMGQYNGNIFYKLAIEHNVSWSNPQNYHGYTKMECRHLGKCRKTHYLNEKHLNDEGLSRLAYSIFDVLKRGPWPQITSQSFEWRCNFRKADFADGRHFELRPKTTKCAINISTQSMLWKWPYQYIPWPLKHIFWHKNQVSMLIESQDMIKSICHENKMAAILNFSN